MTSAAATPEAVLLTSIRRIQLIGIAWMMLEVGVSLGAAIQAHSIALLAFGGDSIIELASALLVFFHFSNAGLTRRAAARTAAILLYLLAAFIVLGSMFSLFGMWLEPTPSYPGIVFLVAAGFVMPWLARQKRRLAQESGSSALAADATQSAVCGWLCWIALAGLLANALFRISWADPLAALALVPLVIKEGRSAWQERTCHCC